MTSRTSATIAPAALVPPPRQGLGIPEEGGLGGFDVLHPVQIPVVEAPLPPDEPALPVEPVPYGWPPEPAFPPATEIVDVEEIMRFDALLARISMSPPAPPPPPWPPCKSPTQGFPGRQSPSAPSPPLPPSARMEPPLEDPMVTSVASMMMLPPEPAPAPDPPFPDPLRYR